jgi:hypothetical protein
MKSSDRATKRCISVGILYTNTHQLGVIIYFGPKVGQQLSSLRLRSKMDCNAVPKVLAPVGG